MEHQLAGKGRQEETFYIFKMDKMLNGHTMGFDLFLG